MTPAILCLAVPLLSGCSEYVEYAPSIAVLEARRSYFSHRSVRVTGQARKLSQWRSPLSGRNYEIFVLCQGECVRVYMEAHSPIYDGERVTVRGVYYREHREGRETYYNEIVAAEIVPRQ